MKKTSCTSQDWTVFIGVFMPKHWSNIIVHMTLFFITMFASLLLPTPRQTSNVLKLFFPQIEHLLYNLLSSQTGNTETLSDFHCIWAQKKRLQGELTVAHALDEILECLSKFSGLQRKIKTKSCYILRPTQRSFYRAKFESKALQQMLFHPK